MSTRPSSLDWSEMCDVGLDVRKRLGGTTGIVLTDKEATVLICAALEYANRLAHEHGDRLARMAKNDDVTDCGCSPEWFKGDGCPASNCVRKK